MSFESWKREPLDKFVKFQRGFDLPKDNFVEGDIPVYGSTSILGYHNQIKVKAPGVITGRSGTLGKFQYAKNDFWPHNTTLWVKDFMGNDPKFVYYSLQCLDFSDFNSGGAVPTLNRNVLKSFKMDIPPLPIQKKIAKILSNYDDLIENNLKQIKLLEEKARLTYEEWFLRFRIDGKKLEIDEETELPFGWEKKNLFDIADVRYGYPFKAEQFNNEANGTPIIRIRNIPSSSTSDYTTEIVDEKYLVKKGDLLIGMDGEFHINHWSGEEGYLVQRVCSIKTKESNLFGYFSEAIKPKIKYYEETISGATVAHLGKKHLEKIEIVVPTNDITQKLEIFNSLLKQKINLATQNNLLKESRNILLPRLMTGIIDVDKLDIEV